MRHRYRTRSVRSTLAVVVVVVLGTSACSGTQAERAATSTTRGDLSASTTMGASESTTTSLAEEKAPDLFTGTDAEFYVAPKPLPAGEPGDLIRMMELGEADGVATVKVMYHSRDAADRDRAVTGLISYPTKAPPEGGWPVVATAPGTVGLSAKCGVSHQATEAPSWGVEGVRVMTDYIGLGPLGDPLHPYFSKPSEGHSVLDGVRAARNLPETGAGDRWLSVGHSQGGHGALSASELSKQYAPELDLVATLALAPAAMFDRVYGGIDPIVTAILTSMSLYGGATEHPEIDVDDYVTTELAAASSVFSTGCLGDITDALIPLAVSGRMFTHDPRKTEPALSLLLANDVGNVVVDAPLFLVSGTADDRVVTDRVRDLLDRLCATGQFTELLIVDGATHDSIIGQTTAQTSAWLNDRLAGTAPTNSCSAPRDG